MSVTRIILASKSPRRRELMELLHIPFEVIVSDIDEQIDYNHLYSLLSKIDVSADLLNERIMRTLSGGEKVKIAILKIL